MKKEKLEVVRGSGNAFRDLKHKNADAEQFKAILQSAAPGSLLDANLEEVAGCLRSKRKSKTPEQMRAAIGREVMRRHGRGRY